MRVNRRGRPTVLSSEQRQKVLDLWDTGDYTMKQIAFEFYVHTCTISRLLRRNRPRRPHQIQSRGTIEPPIIRLAKMIPNLTNAKRRGYEFLLTTEEVCDLITRPCYYCGLAPSNAHFDQITGEPVHYTGIDRVNSLKNYESGNVVPCCWYCNRAKWSNTVEEFLAHAKRVTEFQRAKAAQTDSGTTPPGPTDGS